MRPPPTLMIRDVGDQDTLVDPRSESASMASEVTVLLDETADLHDVVPPFEGSGRAVADKGSRSSARPRLRLALRKRLARASPWLTRQTLHAGMRLALTATFGLVAFQQWRIDAELRETIAELQRGPTLTAPRSHEAPTPDWPMNAQSQLSSDDLSPTRAVDPDPLESRAASLVTANDYRRALPAYRELAARFPENGAFQAMVVALEWKMACARSDFGVGSCP